MDQTEKKIFMNVLKNKYKKYFHKKKVLITGHTGFKGSWLTAWLKYYQAKIYGISLGEPTNPSHYKISKIFKGVNNIKLDLNNRAKLIENIKKIKPDYIFHLAAQPIVSESFRNPVLTWDTNATGTLNILESVRFLKNRCVVVMITSDKCYLNLNKNSAFKEEDALGGLDPYSASKGSAEIIIRSYFNSFFKEKCQNIRIASARAGNVIGGGDWAKDRLVPDCFKNWKKNDNVIIRNPNATRPWQHVLDIIHGYIMLAVQLKENKLINGKSFNFGPGKNFNYSVLEVLNEIKKNYKKANWKIKKNNIYKESTFLRLNTKKSKTILRWKNYLNFKKTIEYTSSWYEKYFEGQEMSEITLSQIKEMISRIK